MPKSETPETPNDDRAAQDEWLRSHAFAHGEQDENGIDLSLLRENLKLTPSERLDRLQAYVDSMSPASSKKQILGL